MCFGMFLTISREFIKLNYLVTERKMYMHDPIIPIPNLGGLNALQRRVRNKGLFEQVLNPGNYTDDKFFLLEVRREVAFGLTRTKQLISKQHYGNVSQRVTELLAKTRRNLSLWSTQLESWLLRKQIEKKLLQFGLLKVTELQRGIRKDSPKSKIGSNMSLNGNGTEIKNLMARYASSKSLNYSQAELASTNFVTPDSHLSGK